MPYIKKEERPELTPYLTPLLSKLQNEGKDGWVSYCIAWLLIHYFGINYKGLQGMTGLLRILWKEMKKVEKMTSEYEDKKRKENGDVLE